MATNCYTRIEDVTPEMARDILARNTHNRSIRARHVTSLVKDLKAGKWCMNGDTICIAEDGTLIDGQHRLTAVVISGVTASMMVVYNLPNDQDVFGTKGIGKSRHYADVLTIAGAKNAAVLATALSLTFRCDEGAMFQAVTFTNNEVVEFYHIYTGMEESVSKCLRSRGMVPASILASCHYMFCRRDRDAADKFVEDTITGVGLAAGDPVLALRDRFIRNTKSSAKLPQSVLMGLTIKAWNQRRKGIMGSRLDFSRMVGEDSVFPKII